MPDPAAYEDCVEVCRLLLEAGADPTMKHIEDGDALFMATDPTRGRGISPRRLNWLTSCTRKSALSGRKSCRQTIAANATTQPSVRSGPCRREKCRGPAGIAGKSHPSVVTYQRKMGRLESQLIIPQSTSNSYHALGACPM